MSLHHSFPLALLAMVIGMTGCARSTPPDTSVSTATESAVVSTPAGPAVAAPTPDTAATLVAYQWQLKLATDATGQSIAAFFPAAEQPLGVEFSDGRLGRGRCRCVGRRAAGAAGHADDHGEQGEGKGVMKGHGCTPLERSKMTIDRLAFRTTRWRAALRAWQIQGVIPGTDSRMCCAKSSTGSAAFTDGLTRERRRSSANGKVALSSRVS